MYSRSRFYFSAVRAPLWPDFANDINRLRKNIQLHASSLAWYTVHSRDTWFCKYTGSENKIGVSSYLAWYGTLWGYISIIYTPRMVRDSQVWHPVPHGRLEYTPREHACLQVNLSLARLKAPSLLLGPDGSLDLLQTPHLRLETSKAHVPHPLKHHTPLLDLDRLRRPCHMY